MRQRFRTTPLNRPMKSILMKTTVLLVILSTLVPAAHGQSPRAKSAQDSKVKAAATESNDAGDEIERLLDRYLTALGGLELFKLKTRVMRGRVEMSDSALVGTFEAYEKEPGKSIMIINVPGAQFLMAKDGNRRWMQTPWGETATAAAVGDVKLLEQAATGKGFKWRNAFSASAIKGRAKVEGRETLVLAATPRGGEPLLIYFDVETSLPLKTERVRFAANDDDQVRVVYFDSYATVDGVKMPALFRQVTAKYTLTFRVTEIKHNLNIDDRLFSSPEGK